MKYLKLTFLYQLETVFSLTVLSLLLQTLLDRKNHQESF